MCEKSQTMTSHLTFHILLIFIEYLKMLMILKIPNNDINLCLILK